KGTDIFQEIFDEMVLQAMNHNMVGVRVLFSDSTHLKANANKHKFTKQEIEVETRENKQEMFCYLDHRTTDSKKCENCPLLSQCTRSKNKVKVVTRHVWED
ncbi:hypothetical protein ACJ005_29475, partial [Neobacillus sp. 211]